MKTFICIALVLLGFSAKAAIYQNYFTTNSAPTFTNSFLLVPTSAQLPTTNFAYPDQTLQQGMLVFPKTNGVGSQVDISAIFPYCMWSYQGISNTLVFEFGHVLISTNGPNISNTVWSVSVLRNNTVTGGAASTNDVQVGPFENVTTFAVPWAASSSGTNKVELSAIPIITGGGLAPGESFSLKLTRSTASGDSFGGAVGVTSARLYWKQ